MTLHAKPIKQMNHPTNCQHQRIKTILQVPVYRSRENVLWQSQPISIFFFFYEPHSFCKRNANRVTSIRRAVGRNLHWSNPSGLRSGLSLLVRLHWPLLWDHAFSTVLFTSFCYLSWWPCWSTDRSVAPPIIHRGVRLWSCNNSG